MKRRGLSDEDKALWAQVRASARPLHPRPVAPSGPAPSRNAGPESQSAERKAAAQSPLPLRAGALTDAGARSGGGLRNGGAAPRYSHNLAPSIHDELAARPLNMHAKTHREMIRGKLRPEARIDLHGMTLAVAHGALIRFIQDAHSRGRRLVLVITGKGKPAADTGPIPARQGALRHEVPHWLSLPPLNRIVLQTTPAHARHGGGGAYYVYLRKL